MYQDETSGELASANPDVPASLPTAEIVRPLLSIAKATRVLVGIHLADLDLEVGQDQLLCALDENEAMTVGNVSNILNIRPSTTSKMSDRLIQKGLVKRCPDSRDQRRTTLLLTPEGVSRRAEVQAAWKQLDDQLALAPGLDVERVAKALQALDTALTTRLARLR